MPSVLDAAHELGLIALHLLQGRCVRLPLSNYIPVQDGGADVAGDEDHILQKVLRAHRHRVARLLHVAHPFRRMN